MGVRVPPFAIYLSSILMDCSAFCTASSYQIKNLFLFLKSRYTATLFRDVIHVELVQEYTGKRRIDLFYFPCGALVCWGTNIQESQPFIQEIEEFTNQPNKIIETDDFTFFYGSELKIIEDEIFLPDEEVLTKLALSHGLAQSVKLGSFESTISDVFEKTKHIPEDLAAGGTIRLSRKQIRKRMGELFINRSSINLHVDVLDTPEFFWDNPDLKPLYTCVANELEIVTRGQILNQRLNVLKELFEMLGNELDNQHSTRLELTIVWLIMIEVMITILTHYKII